MPDNSPASLICDDDGMQHAVRLLQKDDLQFARWADICDNINMVDSGGNTVMHWAASLGNVNALDLLIDLGLDMEAQNAQGASPLICAAASCRNPGSVIALLMRQGANADAKNKNGETMYSLLEKRNLTGLIGLFDQLQSAMEECPKWFVSSIGNDAVSFDMAYNLGSIAAMPKDVSTVRFKNSRMSRTSLCSSASPDFLDASGQHRSPDAFSLSETNNTPGYCCDAAWWLAERDRAIVIAMEDADRGHLMSDYWSQLFSLLSCVGTGAVPRKASSPALDTVAAVLGEKHNAHGQRCLLVRWVDQDHTLNDDVTWVLYDDVAHCAVVRSYIAKFDKTYSSSIHQESYNNYHATALSHEGLDAEERDELERELDRIPRRQLSPDSTVNTGLRSRSVSNDLMRFNQKYNSKESLEDDDVQVLQEDSDRENDSNHAYHAVRVRQLPDYYHLEPAKAVVTPAVRTSAVDTSQPTSVESVSVSATPNPVGATVTPQDVLDAQAQQCEEGVQTICQAHIRQQQSDADECWVPSRRFIPPSQTAAADTYQPRPSAASSSDTVAPEQYKLSDTQKMRYENFLYKSALSILRRKQQAEGTAANVTTTNQS